MHNDEIQTTGIVPVIENLKSMLHDVATEISPLLDEDTGNEPAINIKAKISAMDKKMQRLIESINHSYDLIQLVIKSIHTSRSELKKSVDGLIKKTGMQLQKVTSTTEEATNKILDVAEKLDEDQMKIIDILDKLEEMSESDDNRGKIFEELRQKIYQNQDSAFTIMDYLQFQDITAQQIAGAYALLSDTEKTLLYVSETLKRLDTTFEMSDDMKSEIDKNAFNMDASYRDKATIQSAIDNLFESRDESVEIPEDKGNGSAEKEAHFAVTSDDKETEHVSNDDIDALFSGSSESKEESNSQDDIDKLFSGGNDAETDKKEEVPVKPETKVEDKKSEAASQEEIDKLFG